jgi:hypothetical protein
VLLNWSTRRFRRFAGCASRFIVAVAISFSCALVLAQSQVCRNDIASTFTTWAVVGDTIYDSSTGLSWERCVVGQTWTGSDCTGEPTPLPWASALTGAPVGWRLPNVKELESIIERRCVSPAASTIAFPNIPQTRHWTSTPGWTIDFADATIAPGSSAASTYPIRYVKGEGAAEVQLGGASGLSCNPYVLADQAASDLIVNGDGTVTDRSTGLIWKRCPEGTTLVGDRCTWPGMFPTFEWQEALNLASVTSSVWRLPNVKELESILDRRCFFPAMSGSRFPDQQPINFWSSSPGWAVSFSDSTISPGQPATSKFGVRLVRMGAATASQYFRAGGGGRCSTNLPDDTEVGRWVASKNLITDTRSGLQWDRCLVGQIWDNSQGTCTGVPLKLTWGGALQFAELRFTNGLFDWRLPNLKELESTMDRRCVDPIQNPQLFPGAIATNVWTSTSGWAVNFADGSLLPGHAATDLLAVRLVRRGDKHGAYDARAFAPPGVISGPVRAGDVVNASLLLPSSSAGTQKLVLLAHGWNSSSQEWANLLAKIVCGRIGQPLTEAFGIAGWDYDSDVGVASYCETPEWRVVAFNWKPRARGIDLPWAALAEAKDLGENIGKALVEAAQQNPPKRYEFLHLVAHSAGSNLIHELGRQLKLSPNAPRIQSTFLDAFCGYADRCDYGFWSDWADNYFEGTSIIGFSEGFVQEGTETRLPLCNAANYDLTGTYPIGDEPSVVNRLVVAAASQATGNTLLAAFSVGSAISATKIKAILRHGWPHRCYTQSAASGTTGDTDFDVSCIGQSSGGLGFPRSYLANTSTGLSGWLSARELADPKGTLRKQRSDGSFANSSSTVPCQPSAAPILQAGSTLLTGIESAWGTIKSIPGAMVPAMTCSSTSAAPLPSPQLANAVSTLRTCIPPTQRPENQSEKSVSTASGADQTPIASWTSMRLSLSETANRTRFALQFASAARARLSAYLGDTQIYVTSSDVRGVSPFVTEWINFPAQPSGEHVLSFRLDSLDSNEATVTISSFEFAGNFACGLDIDGDGARTAPVDGVLLGRYLLGFRGDALTAGLSLNGSRSTSSAIEQFLGDARGYDVFGRPDAKPGALQDGLVLTRLMLGVPDSSLLEGIGVPPDAFNIDGSKIRAAVNIACGTRY